MRTTWIHRRAARLALSALAAAALALPLSAQRAERFTMGSRSATLHNLVGEVTVVPGTGNSIVVEVTRGGQDAGQLQVNRSGNVLRIAYPGDRVVYPRMGERSNTTTSVRRDGTLGEGFTGSRRVTVAGTGTGTRAHADVRVLVPAGRTVAVYLAVGRVQVTSVNGRVEVSTRAASVRAQGTRGVLDLAAGSGGVEVRDAQGEVTVRSGSGPVTLSNVRGPALEVDVGSGAVSGLGLRVEELVVDVGSGAVTLNGVAARSVALAAGSGAVNLGLASDADLEIEAGSGGVTVSVPASFGARLDIETGSGGINVDLPVTNRRAARGSLTGSVGDGNGSVQIETGSGGVRIRRG
jgi:lia operon protein LiaG